MAFLDHIIGLGIVISKQDLHKLINLAGPKDGKLKTDFTVYPLIQTRR